MVSNLTPDKEKLFRDLLLKQGIAANNSRNSISKRKFKEKYELSLEQQRIWFLSRLDQKSSAYNVPYILKIEGSIDVKKVNRILNQIILRHEILRTILIEEKGVPYQIILDSYEIEIPVNNVEESSESILEEIRHETSRPFELYGNPLIRGMIFKVNKKSYYLVITLHHLITDGWSLEILMREFSILYQEEMHALPEISFQYADYSEWQRESIHDIRWSIDEKYWKNQFHTLPEALNLVTDYSISIDEYGKGGLYRFFINKEIIQQFKKFCSEQGATLFHGLLAVYRVLLFRYTSQKDIAIGIPAAGRTFHGIENTLGLFINTLALRMPVDENETFAGYLNFVRDISLEALKHQNYPFHYLVKSLNTSRESQHTPLFQTMFVMQNMAAQIMKFQDIQVNTVLIDNQYAQYPISVTVWENEQNDLEGTWEYDTGLFKEETIRRFSSHYIMLIQNIIRNPLCPLSKLEMLSLAEKKQLIYDWNATEKDFDENLTVYDLFERQSLATPDHIAVYFQSNDITYGRLFQMVTQWSNYLCELGVRKDDIIVLHEPISIELIAIILSLIYIGAVYVPIDIEMPMDRLQYIIEDMCPTYIISESYYEFYNKAAYINISDDYIDNYDTVNPREHERSDMACIIYTSGSTGAPKGVWIKNVAITNLIYSFLECYKCTDKDKMMPLTSISSASFIGEIFPMLCIGGTLVLTDKYEYLDMEKITSLIQKEQITIISTVSSVIAKLNQMDMPKGVLRLILSGGEALLPMDINRLSQTVMIVNGYGLTEASVCSTYHMIDQEYSVNDIPIGKPIINTRAYILDSHGNVSPIGSIGELYLGGLGISPGYVNDPELTAKKFIDSPFKSGDRLLRTGDLAYWKANGQIMYCGRRDEQIKIHGFRIDLGEIQCVLNSHSSICDNAIYITNDKEHEKKLCALIELKEGKNITKIELITWLSERLPSYMIPRTFFVTQEIPHNLNGKVDWEKIHTNDFSELISHSDSKKLLTLEEERVAEIWKELLNREDIDYNINFFDSGGHSLLLPQLQSRLNELSQNPISVMDLFRYTTIHSQSKLIKTLIATEYAPDFENRVIKQRAALRSKYIKNRKEK